MSWQSIFLDTFFEPQGWTLPIGPQTAQSNNHINLAPLQFVTDVEPIGYAYHKLVFPEAPSYIVPALHEDEIDPELLIDAVREADLQDYYALLFVSDKGLKVTQDDITKTWKLINLYLHPDKADSARKEQAETLFKACHKAYETLTDPKLKVDYDSSITFDNAIPSEKATYKTSSDFLTAFTPVFERNERWSKSQPCPKLGTETTSEEELTKFYKFWLGFQSWREFPEADKEKVGDSAGRQERRDAEQKNARARALLKQKENTRLRNLAEFAQAADPRVKFYKTSKVELEKAAKQASFDAKTLAIAAKKTKLDQDKAAKTAYDAVIAGGAAGLQTANALSKTAVIAPTKTTTAPPTKAAKATVPLTKTATTPPTKTVTTTPPTKTVTTTPPTKTVTTTPSTKTVTTTPPTKTVTTTPPTKTAVVLPATAVNVASSRGQETLPERKLRLEIEFMAMVKGKLAGALGNDKFYAIEYPEKKAHHIPIIVDRLLGHDDYTQTKGLDDILLQHGYNDIKGVNGRRVLEIDPVSIVWDELEGRVSIKKVQDVTTGPREWEKMEVEAMHRALAKFPVGTKERYAKVTEQVNLINNKDNKRGEKEIIRKVKEDELIRQAGGVEEYNKLKAMKAAAIAGPAAVPVPAVVQPVAPTVDSDVTSWSVDEQKLLEKGLQSVPKDTSGRWELIAGMVGTRSAAQCSERFNFLREQIIAKKAAAAAAAKSK